MSTSLVELQENTTVNVKLVNPFPDDVEIWQDTVTDQADDIQTELGQEAKAEDSQESNNYYAMRRINVVKHGTSKIKEHIQEMGSPRNVSRKVSDQSDVPLSSHLESVYKSAVKG